MFNFSQLLDRAIKWKSENNFGDHGNSRGTTKAAMKGFSELCGLGKIEEESSQGYVKLSERWNGKNGKLFQTLSMEYFNFKPG